MAFQEFDFDAQCDALCVMLPAVEELTGDKDLLRLVRDRKIWKAAGHILSEHRGAVRTILAAWDGVPPDAVRLNLLALPGKIVGILTNPDFVQLFTLQLPAMGRVFSTSASAPAGEDSVDPAQA